MYTIQNQIQRHRSDMDGPFIVGLLRQRLRLAMSLDFFMTLISSSRMPAMRLFIFSVRPNTLTLLIEPKISVVKLMRFSINSSHSFCRLVTTLPREKDVDVKTGTWVISCELADGS
jgi:hypothetical protein